MARTRLIAAAFAAAMTLSPAAVMAGGYPVTDEISHAKLVEQLKQAKKDFAEQVKQLEELKKHAAFLNDIVDGVDSVIATVGEMASIVLPFTDLQAVTAQMQKNIGCLMPDGLDWGLKLDSLDLNICKMHSKYKKAFFLTSDDAKGMTFAEQDAKKQEVSLNRDKFIADTTTRSASLADQRLQSATQFSKTATDLKIKADAAKTVNDRLAVSNNAAIAQLSALAALVETNAQILKEVSALALKAQGLSDPSSSSEDDGL